MKVITLQTKEQLDIFMNPQRQRLLRALARSPEPRTPKDLSLEMGVSASSVQHHLKKLESLGLVRLDHTASVRGITARYYAATRVTVHIGGGDGETLADERAALLKSLVADVLDDTLADILDPQPQTRTGDIETGVAYLAPGRAHDLQELIRDFLQKNEAPRDGCEPWEYAIIYRNAGKKG